MGNVGTLFITVAADASGVARGLSQAEASLERFGSRMFFMGGRITAGVTVPLMGLMGAITKFGADFDNAMTEALAIQQNVTAQMRKDMEQAAMDISERSQFTAAEVAKSYYEMASAGLSSAEQLKAVGTVTDFAQAGLLDTAKSAKVLTTAVNAMGLDMVGATDMASGMAKVADVLTMANNKAIGTIETFSKALTTRAATAGRMYKVSLEEMTAGLMAFHAVGIEGANAGQQMWMVLRDLQRASLNNVGAWKKFGVAIYDANGKMRPMAVILDEMQARFKGFTKEQIASHKTGTDWGKAMGKAFTDVQISQEFMALGFQDRSRGATQAILGMGENIMRFYQDLLKAEGTTAEVRAKQMESFSKRMQMYWHMLQNEGIKMFEALRPILEDVIIPLIIKFLGYVKELVKWFSTLNPEFQKWVVIMTAAAALSGPVIAMMGSWTLFFSGITGLISGATKAFVGFVDLVSAGKVTTILARNAQAAQAAARAAQAAAAAEGGGAIAAGAARLRDPKTGRFVAASFGSKLTGALGGTAAGGAAAGGGGVVARALSSTGALGGSKTVIALNTALQGTVKILPQVWGAVSKFGWYLVALQGTMKWFWENGMDRWRDFFAGLTLGFSEVAISIGKFTLKLGKETTGGILDFISDANWLITDWGYKLTDKIADIGSFMRKGWDEAMSDLADDFENWLYKIRDLGIPIISDIANKLKQALFGGQPAGEPKAPKEGSWAAWWDKSWFKQVDQFVNTNTISDFVQGLSDYRDAVEKSRLLPSKPLSFIGLAPGGAGAGVKGGTLWDDRGTSFPGMEKPDKLTDAQRKAERDAERIRGVMEELAGEGKQRFQDVQVAFYNLMSVGQVTTDVIERLHEEVKKSGIAFQDLPQWIQDATQELHDFEIAMEMANDPLNEIVSLMYGNKPQGDLSKNMGRFENELSQLYKTGKVSDEFLEKYNDEIIELSKNFAHLSPGFRELVLQHSQWTAEMRKGSAETLKAKEVLKGMGDAVDDVVAKMADKNREIETVWMSGGQAALKGIKFNQDKMEKDYEQQLRKMREEFFKNAAFMNKEQILAGVRRLEEFEHVTKEEVRLERQAATDRLLIQTVASRSIALAMKNASLEAKEALIKDLDEIEERWVKLIDTMDQLSSGFGNLASIFDKEGGGTLSWLAEVTGLIRDASRAAADFEKAARQANAVWKNPNATFGEKFAGIASAGLSMFEAATQGMVALDKATSVKGQGKRVLGGVGVGGAVGGGIGGGIGFMMGGPAGAALGKMIGQIGGAFVGGIIGALRKPAFEDVMKRVGREWGVTISEELGKKIADLSKSKFKGDRQAAEIFSLQDILGEAGGLKDSNIGAFMNKFRDIFSMIEKGAFSAAEGMSQYTDQFGQFADYWIARGIDVASVFSDQMAVMFDFMQRGKITAKQVNQFLDTNFAKFAESFEKSGQVASRALVKLIEQYKTLKLESKAVTDFIVAQGSKAGTAWATVISAIGEGRLDDYASKLVGTNEQIKEIQDKIKAGEGDIDSLTEDLNEKLAYRSELMKEQPKLAAEFGAEVQRMGSIVLSTFNKMVAANVPWTQALQSVAPAIDKLNQYYKALGITADNAGLAILTRYRDIQAAHPALFAGVDALAEGTIAVSALGAMTQEELDAIAQQGVAMYERMQGAVAEFGGTTEDALRPMAPWLAAMRDAAEEYGLTLDENTQAMIDQATQSGILKERTRSDAEIMQQGFEDIGAAMAEVAYYLGEIAQKIYGLPSYKQITVDVEYNDPGFEPSAPPPQLPEAAHGIYATGSSGVATWFGEGGQPELGGPKDFMSGVLAAAMRDAGGGSWGDQGDMNVTLVMPDGDVLLQQVIKAGKRRGVM